MMKRGRLLTILSLAFAVACGGESTTPGAIANADLPADNVIHELTHRMTREGIRTAELRGDTAYLYEVDRRFDLKGVNLVFFQENGEQSGTLTSRTGEYRMGSGAFIARGDVVLITQGPHGTRRVETEELHYDVGGDQIWSDVEFVMREGGRITRGTSFRSDARFETWTITDARTEGGVGQPGSGVSF